MKLTAVNKNNYFKSLEVLALKKKLVLGSIFLMLMTGIFTVGIVNLDNSSNDSNKIELKEVRDGDETGGYKFF